MLTNLSFDDWHNSPEDVAGVIGYEIQIIALGSFSGGAGGSPAMTLLGTFSTPTLAVPLVIVNQTAVDIAAAISGTFDTTVVVDRGLLVEDIAFQYRTQTATGFSEWVGVQILGICPPATTSIALTPPSGVGPEQLGTWEIEITASRAGGAALGASDRLLIELLDESMTVIAYAEITEGADITNAADTTTSSNWSASGSLDGNVATHIEMAEVMTGANLLAGASIYLNKKPWATQNGLIGINNGEDITVRVTAFDLTCTTEPTPSTAVITKLTFAEFFVPFVGKQAAPGYPEYVVPATAIENPTVPNHCLNEAWVGFALRNGALTSKIKEVTLTLPGQPDKVFNTDTEAKNYPLPPLTHGDSAVSCTGGGSTPLLGYDLSGWFVQQFDQGVGGGIQTAVGIVVYNLAIEYELVYAPGTLTSQMQFQIYYEAENADDPLFGINEWTFDALVSATLIARGDAAVYGSNTTASGLTVDLAFNVNNTRLNSVGAITWGVSEVRIADTPGAAPGSFTTYQIAAPTSMGVSGGLPAAPDNGISATSIGISHLFPSQGYFEVELELTTETVGSSITGFAVIAEY